MERTLIDGDYVPDGAGGLKESDGAEEVLARVLFRLTARRFFCSARSGDFRSARSPRKSCLTAVGSRPPTPGGSSLSRTTPDSPSASAG